MRQLLDAAIVIGLVGAFFWLLPIHDRPRCTDITASVFAPDECQ